MTMRKSFDWSRGYDSAAGPFPGNAQSHGLTGARLLKRTGLKRNAEDLAKFIGRADQVFEDERLEQIKLLGGQGKTLATIVVGAATREVVGERKRMAKDAASAAQAALKGGLVAGGGAIELALARQAAQDRSWG